MKQFQLNNRFGELQLENSIFPVPFISCPDQICYDTKSEAGTLRVKSHKNGKETFWDLYEQSDQLWLKWASSSAECPGMTELLAAIEASLASYPHHKKMFLSVPTGHMKELFDSGILTKDKDNQIMVYVDIFWQQARVWRPSIPVQAFPVHYVFNHGFRHPLRPPKPEGKVYHRYISWLGRTLSFRTIDLVTDLNRFNRWMNDPVVAEFWQEEGDLPKHLAYLAAIEADPHVIGLIGCFDDEPFGYFEIYWAKENRISPHYDVNDFDRGWHVLIGEPHMRGKPFVTAWLPSISHYLFLDDDRTQRLVIEPRVDNHKMIRNLVQCGYANIKEIDFPHKRAMLGLLQRERFFTEQLWVPRRHSVPQSVTLS